MRHRIRLADVENYIFERQLAASYGREEHKELKAVMCGHHVHYEVWSFREKVFSGRSLDDAVWAYNNE